MRILFLTPWYPDDKMPHHGVFVRDQANAVANAHEVQIISSKVDYSAFKIFSWRVTESTFERTKEYRVVMNRSFPFLNQINYLFISIWVAYRIGRKFRPDIIHGNIAYPGAFWAYSTACLLTRPFVISDHTSRFTDNFRSVFHRAVTTFSMRRAKSVIAVSSWAGQNIERLVQRHVDVVPNLIHVEDYGIAQQKAKPVHIGFLGGLSSEIHRKGLDLLIKAITPIKKDYVLHVGGHGKFLEYYMEMSRSHGVFSKVRFHGFIPSVPDFMKQLHFFISASRIEAFGMVIAEAMACGLPVITTNSGGPADFIDHECGRMVPVEDVGTLTETINWMIDNYQSFDRNKIRQKIVDNYSEQAFMSRINRIYENAVSHPVGISRD